MEKEDVMQRTKRKGVPVTMSSDQQKIFQGIEEYVQNRTKNDSEPYNLPTSLPARDRSFVEELANSLHLQWSTVEDKDGNRHMQLSFPSSSGNSAGRTRALGIQVPVPGGGDGETLRHIQAQ